MVMTFLDGDGFIFPGALAIAESENKESWSWFLSNVRTAFHIEDGGQGLVFLTDREKGIDAAIKTIIPSACHSFCVYHMEKNVKVTFQTTPNGLLFDAAYAVTQESFEEAIGKMRLLHSGAAEYVEKIDKKSGPGRYSQHVASGMLLLTSRSR